MGIIADKFITNDIYEDLKKLDDIVFTQPLENVEAPVNTHPDIQIHFVRKDLAVCPPELYEYYREKLPDNIELLKGRSLCRTYPSHIAYNVARVGKYVICSSEFTDENIIDLYTKTGYKIINVRQGYAKCNLCVVNDNAVITEDRGIAKTLSEYDFDILLINPGDIRLKGFEYGFIGGASGLIGNTLVFSGRVELHPQSDIILKFLNKHGIIYLSLGNNSLCDYGSLLEF